MSDIDVLGTTMPLIVGVLRTNGVAPVDDNVKSDVTLALPVDNSPPMLIVAFVKLNEVKFDTNDVIFVRLLKVYDDSCSAVSFLFSTSDVISTLLLLVPIMFIDAAQRLDVAGSWTVALSANLRFVVSMFAIPDTLLPRV